jgi:hypothetical protein
MTAMTDEPTTGTHRMPAVPREGVAVPHQAAARTEARSRSRPRRRPSRLR